jgi:hypothetical protein
VYHMKQASATSCCGSMIRVFDPVRSVCSYIQHLDTKKTPLYQKRFRRDQHEEMVRAECQRRNGQNRAK